MKYGLVGKPLGHSFSPALHRMIGDYDYALCEPDDPEAFFKDRSFSAVNVTIPYKQAVIPWLDHISPDAQAIGAVNTVVNRNGALCGYNTDYSGVLALLERLGVTVRGKKCLVLGTGGTAKTVHYALERLGAAKIAHVSRSSGYISYKNAHLLCPDTQILFNTTPVGMSPDLQSRPLDICPFLKLEAVLDAVYNPLRTRLILDALERGIPCAGGLYMLAAQAEEAAALFFDRPADIDHIGTLYRQISAQMRNLVLIGMPTCGKTTVGTLLAEKLSRPFLDLDGEFARREGVTAADYIKVHGEKAFRSRESALIASLAETRGAVIATGGGAVLEPANVRALRHNGLTVWLDRPPELLRPAGDRPLSADRQAMNRLYIIRRKYYREAADVRIDARFSKADTVQKVLAAWNESDIL